MRVVSALRQSEERRYGRYCVRPVGSSWCVTKMKRHTSKEEQRERREEEVTEREREGLI
jgi:hypothetical protein